MAAQRATTPPRVRQSMESPQPPRLARRSEAGPIGVVTRSGRRRHVAALDAPPSASEEAEHAGLSANEEPTDEEGAGPYNFPRSTADVHRLVEDANWLHDAVRCMQESLLVQSPPIATVVHHSVKGPEAPIVESACVVCMHRAQKVAFSGCGHLCLCVICAKAIVKFGDFEHAAKCPVCRHVSVPIALRQP